MKKQFFLVLAAAVTGLSLSLAGCAAVVVGAAVGTAVYLEGDLEGYVATGMRGAVDATLAAAEDLNLKTISKTGDVERAMMVAHDPKGQKVTIKLQAQSPKLTKVKIRIGVAGSEDDSRKILNAIEKRAKGGR